MEKCQRLLDFYLPPDGFVLESLVATTYHVDFEFLEEQLLATALGIRSPLSRMKTFRSELERKLQTTDVSILYDLGGCDRIARLSPRIDPLPVVARKLHAKITLLTWARKDRDNLQASEKRIRLIVGSANLTRQGFRENYECVVSADYGGRGDASREQLQSAIALVRRIAADTASPQLTRQLAELEAQAAKLSAGNQTAQDPLALVSANEVVSTLKERWTSACSVPPTTIRIVSPFWPEGARSVDTLAALIQSFGVPETLELICRSALSADGKTWLPEFDSQLAQQLRQRLSTRVLLRPALPQVGEQQSGAVELEGGDETEDREFAQHRNGRAKVGAEAQRNLHAKMVSLEGPRDYVLYVGSSNCTRKGMALGGPSNWEAGFVYHLSGRRRRELDTLFAFAGPSIEVLPNQPPQTATPAREDDQAVPNFLAEITATGEKIAIRFRAGAAVPPDLCILMPIPAGAASDRYRILWSSADSSSGNYPIVRELSQCLVCDESLSAATDHDLPCLPHVLVEVRWEGNKATFPVRFDDKAALPLLLVGRKATEGELIEYFLYGRESDDEPGGGVASNENGNSRAADDPIDTRRILAYFIRQFVQAIPGIEHEIRRSAYSRTALDSALRGPTSPLELAERAFASLAKPPAWDEPLKTPIAVAFQVTEILAAVLRCRERIADRHLASLFEPVVARCRELLDLLAADHSELQSPGFQEYRQRFVGSAP